MMSPELGLAIMMNNYFHDVATALLLSSAAALWVMLRIFRQTPTSDEAARYFLAIYRGMSRLAVFSLGWIILGGIPRVWAYERFEWANAVGKLQVPALVLKHVLAFTFVGLGLLLWSRLRKQVAAVRASLSDRSA